MTETTQRVFVTVWTHRHGEDIHVFQTANGAELWRQSIAVGEWDAEMKSDEVMPDDLAKAADVYFDIMGAYPSKAEFFEVYTKMVGA